MIKMNLFKEELKKDLIEINKRLEVAIDDDIIQQLLKDKEYILGILYPETIKISFKYINKESKEEIGKIIKSSQFYLEPLKKIKCTNNNIYVVDLFKKFLLDDKFNLRNTFTKIRNYNGIKYLNSNHNYYGATTYINSLNKNYIEICKTKNIFEYSTLIHELGHAKMNFIGNKFCFNKEKSSYEETYPIFLELIFSDFLKDNGMAKESYKIKYFIYKQIRMFSRELNEEYYDYLKYSDKQNFSRFIFELKYRYFKSMLLALQFYYMYKSNPDLTMRKIEYFINNIYKVTDRELLKYIGIDIHRFNNKNVNKLYNGLKEQKEKIKRK